VIIERPGPKQALMARIEKAAKPTAIISSNTSGIPIHIIAEGRTPEFKQRFLGTHFFNPPRYLHLLEIIPTPDTDPAIISRMKDFAENVLGKGVVVCKDTPNFVANRMISFIQSDVMEFAIENGYTVEAVDALTGPLLGRPKTGTFRLNDIVGIDVMALVGGNLYDLIPADEDREILRGEYGSAVMKLLVDNKLLGNKTGQGFYKTVVDEKGKKSFWGLDLQTAAEDGKAGLRRAQEAEVEQRRRGAQPAAGRPAQGAGRSGRRSRRVDLAHPFAHDGLRLQARAGDRRQPGRHRQRHEMGLCLGDGAVRDVGRTRRQADGRPARRRGRERGAVGQADVGGGQRALLHLRQRQADGL
jgi:3-hydroxyacyl-CoA dehydrogenase